MLAFRDKANRYNKYKYKYKEEEVLKMDLEEIYWTIRMYEKYRQSARNRKEYDVVNYYDSILARLHCIIIK